MERNYQLFCEVCKNRLYFDDPANINIVEFKRSKIQSKLPGYDFVNKKPINAEYQSQPKLYKCGKCGYLMKTIKLKKEEL